MTSTLTIDKAGRIVIPKTVRDELRLDAGDVLELLSDGEQITLRPARAVSFRKEDGVWVLRTGQPLPAEATDQVLHQLRDERDRRNQGRTT